MRYLLDTGILLRLLNRDAPAHGDIRRAIRGLKALGNETVTTYQNVSEFWNVCTRPADARDGLGLTTEETGRRLRTIEQIVSILPDTPDAYAHWKTLVSTHEVKGVQVHDAKLVAIMNVHAISHILTLNPHDFSRYPTIVALTPEQVLATPGSP